MHSLSTTLRYDESFSLRISAINSLNLLNTAICIGVIVIGIVEGIACRIVAVVIRTGVSVCRYWSTQLVDVSVTGAEAHLSF